MMPAGGESHEHKSAWENNHGEVSIGEIWHINVEGLESNPPELELMLTRERFDEANELCTLLRFCIKEMTGVAGLDEFLYGVNKAK